MSPDAVVTSRPSFADRALEQLCHWPALEVCQPGCGAAVGLAAGAREIVHLHRPGEAELYLTWPVIERLSAALAGNLQVQFTVGSDWIRLQLDSDGDVSLLLSLTSLAIHANARIAHRPGGPGARCPHRTCRRHRGSDVRPRRGRGPLRSPGSQGQPPWPSASSDAHRAVAPVRLVALLDS